MPYMTDGKRDYKKEYRKYSGKPAVVKKRIETIQARRELEKKGLVHKNDGKDVDHIRPLSKGGANTDDNLRIVDRGVNRSFSRNPDGSMKSQISKRERSKK